MGSPVDTEKYMKPKVSSMCLANNSSLGGVVFVCCKFFLFIADKPMGMNTQDEGSAMMAKLSMY